ncbi:GntR family transcriptional regulator [Acidisoma cladoniae]|jgi:DNA-binding GntR family transcriptional regulator|uniref:GntR family transcriptional regulator n=1 Tax=Acidisoma cladoniae TaxID=3040935 RepID=UPI00254F3827|nr:GntR family transcriptional regulator [Acidisoma sp. PAMC 29798]
MSTSSQSPSSQWRIETPKTNSEQAYDRLRRAIIDGEFRPGERLTEVAIAAMFGISRTPVREAFARLAKDGLVRAAKGSGIEVVDPSLELTDIYYIREAIEGCAARLAALRATDEEIARILDLAQASRDADPTDVETRAQLNLEFHMAITTAARAPRLERLVSDYRELFASPRSLQRYTPSETRTVIDDHGRIAEAIRDRDPDTAEKAIREHLRRTYDLLFRVEPV